MVVHFIGRSDNSFSETHTDLQGALSAGRSDWQQAGGQGTYVLQQSDENETIPQTSASFSTEAFQSAVSKLVAEALLPLDIYTDAESAANRKFIRQADFKVLNSFTTCRTHPTFRVPTNDPNLQNKMNSHELSASGKCSFQVIIGI